MIMKLFASGRGPSFANPSNPILAAIRHLYSEEHATFDAKAAIDSARYLTHGTHSLGLPITEEHKEHAFAVLTRLAEFGGEVFVVDDFPWYFHPDSDPKNPLLRARRPYPTRERGVWKFEPYVRTVTS